MNNLPSPVSAQIGPNSPAPAGLDTVTSPLYPPQTLLFRLRGFSPEVYDLSPQSHLMRLLGVILGDAGGEQARKRSTVNRLRMSLSTTSFLDLDAFWGTLAGLNRAPAEQLPSNPTTGMPLNPYYDSATLALWTQAHQADASYRDRIIQFSRAIQGGASPVGIRAVAEAVLATPVDLYEDFSSGTTYLATIVPHRPLSLSEMYNLKRILDQIKPAQARVEISQAGTQPTLGVPLAQAWGSSNYWQVLATITPGPHSLFQAVTERPGFPFSQYQGESWCINDAIVGIVAELWDPYEQVLATDSFEHYVWSDGTFTNYSPGLSVRPQWEVDLGRLAQSGVTSANPLTLGGNLSLLLVDGLDPVALRTALDSTGLTFQVTNHDYWSTPPRLPDGTSDVITYSLDQLHYVDSISFEVASFPHQVTLQIEDPVAGVWVNSFSQTIGVSNPRVLVNPLADQIAHRHPQHSSDDAWISFTIRITPARVQNIRLVLSRISGIGPLDPSGAAVPYSLGVRNLNLQMIIDSPDLLPVGGGDIDTVTNVLGDQVTYSVYQENPGGPITQRGQWRCSPQVSSQAVVNYYVDSRDITGAAQILDGFYVEPTHQGVHCTLYWSDDQPTPPGQAVDDVLPVSYTGAIQPSGVGLIFDNRFGSTITIPHSVLRYSQALSWWAGLSFYASPNTPQYHLFLFGQNTVQVDVQAGSVTLTTASGDTLTVNGVAFTSNATNSVVVAYVAPQDLASTDIVGNQYGAFYIRVQDPGDATLLPTSLPTDTADDVIIGDANNGSGITLSNFVLKGEAVTTAIVNDFVANPGHYCDKGAFYGQDTGLTTNAYVRFDPKFVSSDNIFGFVGGAPDVMANLNWTPVARDFILTKGTLSLHPTRAKFWKFEMTNLVAEPYSVYLPQVPVATQMMPLSSVAPGTSSSTYQGAVPAGVNSQIAMAYGEQGFKRSTLPVTPSTDPRRDSPTTTLVSSRPTTAQTLAGRFLNFGYLSWAQSPNAPMDPSGGLENYVEEETGQIQQVAFFCGFITVLASRTNIAAKIDTESYMESFLDQINWETL